MVENKDKTKILGKIKNSTSLGKRSAKAITPEEVNKLITSVCYNYVSGNRRQSPRSPRAEGLEAPQSRVRHSEADNQTRNRKAPLKGPNEKTKIEDLSPPPPREERPNNLFSKKLL